LWTVTTKPFIRSSGGELSNCSVFLFAKTIVAKLHVRKIVEKVPSVLT
jgi:hypothetical protein